MCVCALLCCRVAPAAYRQRQRRRRRVVVGGVEQQSEREEEEEEWESFVRGPFGTAIVVGLGPLPVRPSVYDAPTAILSHPTSSVDV